MADSHLPRPQEDEEIKAEGTEFEPHQPESPSPQQSRASEEHSQPQDDHAPADDVSTPVAAVHPTPAAEDVSSPVALQPTPPAEDVSTPVAVHPVPPDNVSSSTHARSASTATAASRVSSAPILTPLPTSAIILSALEAIAASKEAKRNQELGTAASTAVSHIKETPEARFDPEILFHPLELATKASSVSLQITALDCLGTLITFSYFAFPSASAASKSREDSSNQENRSGDQAAEGEQATNQQRQPQPPLIERAINTICDCFELQKENTPNEVQQQIIKSLLAAVLNDRIVVHGRGLLTAVRQIYNIFIYSKSSAFQQVAQGSLIHIVSTVFDRLKTRLDLREMRLKNLAQERVKEEEAQEVAAEAQEDISRSSSSMGIATTLASEDGKTPTIAVPEPSSEQRDVVTELPKSKAERIVSVGPSEKLTLQSFENTKDETMGSDNAPTTVTRARPSRPKRHSVASGSFSANLHEYDDKSTEEEIEEIYAKDAFLVFRAMCRLSQRHKHLTHEQQHDVKSQTMRTKLVFLHIIHHLLNNYTSIFTSPLALVKSSNSSNSPSLTFCQAVKGDLCLSLSRNSASAVPLVYEVCCEIFWLLVKHMRMMMKKELEVFWKEVYLAILDKRNSPLFQKLGFLDLLHRLAGEPRALVEIYLNYDCDRNAWENIFQGVIEHLSKISAMPVSVTPAQEAEYHEYAKVSQPSKASEKSWTRRDSLPPSLATTRLAQWQPSPAAPADIPPDYVLKQRGLVCLVDMVRSLDSWCSPQIERDSKRSISFASHPDLSRDSIDAASSSFTSTHVDATPTPNGTGSISSAPTASLAEDDPQEMEKVKQRKTALSDAIRQFNYKPTAGLKVLLSQGFIRSSAPEDIAYTLLNDDHFDKTALGEFLGEGDPQNIAIMHAFVDFMNFKQQSFVTALRNFLQTFRLPGESQKIDRFMLKFAERYLASNQSAFATADTPYVLAYSVIMLNTDLHSGKLKRPMTKEDFIKNNRGINDNKDLPDEYLGQIYDEIQNNEIVLNIERETATKLGILAQPSLGLASRAGQVLTTIGRDIEGEKHTQASEEITTRTERLYRRLIQEQRKSSHNFRPSRYIPATSVQHVGHMFNVTWMSFLSGLSAPVQDTNNTETLGLAMEGVRTAIHISCIFDLETPREAFVMALANFTNLSNPREMTAKNLKALRVLLEIAIAEGNMLKSSWRDILFCISQLDRLQLLTERVDEASLADRSSSRFSRDTTRKLASTKRLNTTIPLSSDVVMESRSTDMIRMVDAIYTNTANLSSEAIVDFVQALTLVSWQEIQSSANSEAPRMYCLQKLVEVSYYNMTRVRIEWSRMWEVLGRHFNQVGCHTNTHVVFFALDSLRQLSMRFMEIAELPGFKFQKDFLKPFEHVMANSNAASVKDMVLRCLSQMVQTRSSNIRSGWKTMFGVFIIAAKEPYEGIVNMAMEHVSLIYDTRFPLIITQGAFMDMIICLTEFSKNLRFQKKSLQAIEMLKMTAPKLLNTPECPLYNAGDNNEENAAASSISLGGQTPEEQLWYPLLIAFQDVLMTGDDLEVRSRALTYLFQILIRHGGDFPREFWDVLWRQLLYPIFVVLQSKSEMMKISNHEELSVWLSTTMIQALRNMITLFTHYLESLKYMLDRFLGLLTLCICQENDTIARIGSNCLQQLILQNVSKFNDQDWHQIVAAFVDLFERTTARELFSAAQPREEQKNSVNTSQPRPELISGEGPNEQQQSRDDKTNDVHDAEDVKDASRVEEASGDAGRLRSGSGASASSSAAQPTASRRRFFNKIITNCVLQLLMIETVHELFSNDSVLEMIPGDELLTLTESLKKSYLFAKDFHEAKELRLQLWRLGFMKQPPNLLKQESGSAATYVNILFRLYNDNKEDRIKHRAKTEEALLPLCTDIIRNYVHLDEETQQRNIAAWRPVVVDVMEGVISFPTEVFGKYIETLYPILIELLNRDVTLDIRLALQAFLKRVGELRLGMPASSQASYMYGSWNGTTRGRRKTSPRSFSK